MTLPSLVNRNNYIGSGITGPYAYAFKVFAVSDLLVTVRDPNGLETELHYPGDFTATGIGTANGGNVTLTVALAVNWALSIRRVRPLTQGTELRNQGPYFPNVIEDAFDNQTMVSQQLDDTIQRSVHLPESIDPAAFDASLPGNMLPGNAIVVNATGDGFSMSTIDAATLTAWNATHDQKIDVFTSSGGFTPGVTTTLTLSAAPGATRNIWVTRRTSGVNVVLETDEYSISGTTLTFTVAIPTGTTRVEVRYFYTYQINTAAAANVTYAPLTGSGTDVQTRLRLHDSEIATLENDVIGLHVLDFGVVGDGTMDDTVALQAALTAGHAQKKVVYAGSLRIKITAGVNMSGPGFVFDTVSPEGGNEPGIYPSGSGYTALTVNPASMSQFRVVVWGSGNACGGIYFNNPQASRIERAHAENLDGFGIKIDKMWDCVVTSMSVISCGNLTDYAFSMNGVGDTCNHTLINHLQVELANAKAIYIDPTSVDLVVNNLHSERALADPAVTTWDISAVRSCFNTCRFDAQAPSINANLILGGEHTTFLGINTEADINVEFVPFGPSPITIITPDIQGHTTFTTANGTVVSLGGEYAATLRVVIDTTTLERVKMWGTTINTLEIYGLANPGIPSRVVFDTCDIAAVTSASTLSAATFVRCVIAECNDLCEYATVIDQCVLNSLGTLNISGTLWAYRSTINTAVVVGASATLLGVGTRFNGDLSGTIACSSLLDAGCYCTGTVTLMGIPTVQPSITAQTGQVWRKGQRHHNLAPVSGGPPGWVCTTAGGTGTFVFKAEANLA